MIKKKMLFSLGSLSIISPILFTISCGNIEYEEDRTLLSNSMMQVMEKDWQKKVLNFNENVITKEVLKKHYLQNESEPEIKEIINIIEKYLSKKVRNNKNWLREKSDQIIKNDSKKTIQIETGLFNENFRFKNIDFKSHKEEYKNKIINTIDLLWSMEDGNFQREIYKILIVRKYLQEANKNSYLQLNNQTKEDLVGLENKYDEESFALIKMAMDQKMLLKWEVLANNLHSLDLVDRDKKNFQETQQYIEDDATFKKAFLNFSSKQKTLSKQFDLAPWAPEEANMHSFNGIYEQKESSINLDIMKSDQENELQEKMKNPSDLKGFVYNNEIITKNENDAYSDDDKKIEIIPDGENKIKVTYVKFLLPKYDETSEKIIFEDANRKEKMLNLISTYHADQIYETAKKWFRSTLNKTRKAIILENISEKYKKWLIEEKQFKLVEKFDI